MPDGYADRRIRTAALLDRYAARLGELMAPAGDADGGDAEERRLRTESGDAGLMRRLARIAGLAGTLALALAIGLVPALAPSRVAAARPNLTLVGHATYDVLPDEGRVAVAVELTATNHLRTPSTRRYFFRTGVPDRAPGNVAGSSSPAGLASRGSRSRSAATDYTNLRIDFGANLAAGQVDHADPDVRPRRIRAARRSGRSGSRRRS